MDSSIHVFEFHSWLLVVGCCWYMVFTISSFFFIVFISQFNSKATHTHIALPLPSHNTRKIIFLFFLFFISLLGSYSLCCRRLGVQYSDFLGNYFGLFAPHTLFSCECRAIRKGRTWLWLVQLRRTVKNAWKIAVHSVHTPKWNTSLSSNRFSLMERLIWLSYLTLNCAHIFFFIFFSHINYYSGHNIFFSFSFGKGHFKRYFIVY